MPHGQFPFRSGPGPDLSRRVLLAGGLAGLAALAGPSLARARPQAGLVFQAAPSASSIVLAHLVESGALAETAPGATVKIWRNPDELRAGVASGQVKVFNTPSNLPANLYNRGVPVRLLNIMSMGHLYVMTADPSVNDLADLKGRTVGLFFKNDMPDLVFRWLAGHAGLEPGRDFQVSYAASHMEAAQLLIAGKTEIAVLAEPAASAAQRMASHQGVTIRRAIDLQQVWGRLRGGPARIPMAGIAVTADLVTDSPELITALHQGCARSAAWLADHPQDAADLAARVLELHGPIAAEMLKHAGVQVLPARALRQELEGFYAALAEVNPGALGGGLPGEDFYLDPPA